MTLSVLLYNILIHLALPVVWLSTILGFWGRKPLQAVKTKFSPVSDPPRQISYWLHGASVGEVELVKQLRKWLIDLGVNPDKILISTQTFSGWERVEHQRKIILPFDYPWLIKPLVERVAPDWLFVIETEIWPNLYRYNSGKTVIFNARIKEKTYRKYRLITPLIRSTLSHCNSILARDKGDREKFESLAPDTVDISAAGSLKWLQLLESVPELAASSSQFSSSRPVLVAGSTHAGEEELVLELASRHNLSVYLAPRHLNRLSEVKKLLDNKGLSWCLWSDKKTDFTGQVILVDEIGVLASLYRCGDVAFVGGSWDKSVGGHNLLEPARFEVPVLTGPWLQNVTETAVKLEEEGLLYKAANKPEWFDMAEKIFTTPLKKLLPADINLTAHAEEIKSFYLSKLRNLVEAKKK